MENEIDLNLQPYSKEITSYMGYENLKLIERRKKSITYSTAGMLFNPFTTAGLNIMLAVTKYCVENGIHIFGKDNSKVPSSGLFVQYIYEVKLPNDLIKKCDYSPTKLKEYDI